jgi:3-oxoacyl-[acyl-carrier protein] reductase
MPKNIENKKGVVIGAGSGIGAATAEFLAERGFELVLIGRTKSKLEKVSKKINDNFNTKSVFIVGDISSLEDVKSMKKKISKRFRKIDFMINAAGVSLNEEQGEASIENFDEIIDANLKGVYLSTLLIAYPLMRKGGSIVNVSSIRGRTGTPSFSSTYAAAKAGVINMTKSFAFELASKNIRVNCISPGATYPTGMSKKWSKSLRAEIAESVPMKRLGKPVDMAKAIYFFVSDLSRYITGQTLDVNGGAWMN